jgi:hypothetical protein
VGEEFSLAKLRAKLAGVREKGIVRTDKALTELALVIEAKYTENLGKGGSHRYGEPRSASPYPSVISGQLRRSATHAKIHTPEGLAIKVGPASTPRAPYTSGFGGYSKSGRVKTRKLARPTRSGSTNGVVGKALETGLRNGTKYPALLPAFEEGIKATHITFRRVFTGGW